MRVVYIGGCSIVTDVIYVHLAHASSYSFVFGDGDGKTLALMSNTCNKLKLHPFTSRPQQTPPILTCSNPNHAHPSAPPCNRRIQSCANPVLHQSSLALIQSCTNPVVHQSTLALPLNARSEVKNYSADGIPWLQYQSSGRTGRVQGSHQCPSPP